MSRAIFVLCIGRDGSSATSGILHKMGVHMGSKFEEPGLRVTPHGSYEDAEFYDVTKGIIGGQITPSPEAYVPLVKKRAAGFDVWGVKHPAHVNTAHMMIQAMRDCGVDVRLVVPLRNPAHIVNSYMRAWYKGRIFTEGWYLQASERRAARLLEFDGPKLQVHFELLMQEPVVQAQRLAQFVFEGLSPPSEKKILKAAEHVLKPAYPKRSLDWGRISPGVRIGKHPEAQFVSSWTGLIASGLRSNDRPLLPAKHMPSHWAGTELARDFLMQTDCDTLLMIDDDMAFPYDVVERMRSNEDSFEYDVVMALIMRRGLDEPSPVMMKWLGPIKEPDSLKGKHFTLRPQFDEGKMIEVDALGLAFTMIRRHVLESMIDDRWGVEHTEFFTWGHGREGDDVPFCNTCFERGFRMGIDTTAQVAHIAAVPLTWDMLRDRVEDSKQNAAEEHFARKVHELRQRPLV